MEEVERIEAEAKNNYSGSQKKKGLTMKEEEDFCQRRHPRP